MNTIINKLLGFIKSEVVLCVSFLLAAVSSFIIKPDSQYIKYIDWNTLLLLFALMAVMAGLQQLGLFSKIGNILLSKISTTRQMMLILIFLPFVLSMFITNDVALITFVPFGLVVLNMADKQNLAIPLVIFQTIAANLGSMLMPMGNPQNLYLYAQSGMTLRQFIYVMLPYTVLSAICLFFAVIFMKSTPFKRNASSIKLTAEADRQADTPNLSYILISGYVIGFAICLLSVAKILPNIVPAIIILIFLLIFDRRILGKIDYSLLATFICFFIFIGNMGRHDSFCNFINQILSGNERIVAVLASQIISNVPAALLLSGFSNEWEPLIVGCNLGGLGTLIASMASLISYKQIAKQYPDKKGKYLGGFTLANIIMLIILLIAPF